MYRELELRSDEGGVSFDVRVAPRASRAKVMGVHDKALKISLTAAPVDGAANAALIKFLAKRLGVARTSIEIVRGQHSRSKTLHVRDADAAQLRAMLVDGR